MEYLHGPGRFLLNDIERTGPPLIFSNQIYNLYYFYEDIYKVKFQMYIIVFKYDN